MEKNNKLDVLMDWYLDTIEGWLEKHLSYDKNSLFSIFNQNNLGRLLLYLKKSFHFLFSSLQNIIVYAIVSFIYLQIYDSLGFEKTIVLLLVGVVTFAYRRN